MTRSSLIKNFASVQLAVGAIMVLFVLSCSTPHPEKSETLVINIPKKSMKKLTGFVKKALKQEVITNDLKKYVKASIVVDEKIIPIKIRLKGDWTDHIKTDRWSFRIKITDESTYKGFKAFSIMSPETRGNLNEWFIHKLLEDEGVLTTRYDFIPVIINGTRKGVYAIEEHFAKELLLAKNRKVGPILKIAEDGYWEVTNKQKRDSSNIAYWLPIYDACVIKPFQQKRILKSPKLLDQFYKGQDLLYSHKRGSKPVDSLLFIEKYAKYYALGDLCKILHGFETHNQRWYYNSDVNRLEPVAYDICVPSVMSDEDRHPMFGFKGLHLVDINETRRIIPFTPFNSSTLNEMYYKNLVRFSKRTYLDSVFNALDEEIRKREKLVQENDNEYKFNTDFYYHNSERILADLDRFKNKKYREAPLYHLGPFIVKDSIFDFQPLTYVSLNSYYDKRDSTLVLENFYFSPIYIVGYIDSQKKRHECDTIYIDEFHDSQSPTWSKQFIEPEKIIFKTMNWDKLYYAKVIPWGHPSRK